MYQKERDRLYDQIIDISVNVSIPPVQKLFSVLNAGGFVLWNNLMAKIQSGELSQSDANVIFLLKNIGTFCLVHFQNKINGAAHLQFFVDACNALEERYLVSLCSINGLVMPPICFDLLPKLVPVQITETQQIVTEQKKTEHISAAQDDVAEKEVEQTVAADVSVEEKAAEIEVKKSKTPKPKPELTPIEKAGQAVRLKDHAIYNALLVEFPLLRSDFMHLLKQAVEKAKQSTDIVLFLSNIKFQLADFDKYSFKKSPASVEMLRQKNILLTQKLKAERIEIAEVKSPPPLHAPKELSSQQQLKKAASFDFNYEKCNALVMQFPELQKALNSEVRQQLSDKKIIPTEFVMHVNIYVKTSFELLQNNVESTLMQAALLFNVLRNPIDLDELANLHQKINLTGLAEKLISKHPAVFTRDCFEQLAEKIKTVEQRIQQEIDAQFQLLEKCAAGLSLKRSSISKILDRVNSSGETALMVAIRRGLCQELILYLIAATSTDKIVARHAETKQNAIHYLFKYLNKRSKSFAIQLLSKFHTEQPLFSLDKLDGRDVDGNGVMHLLIQYNNDEKLVLDFINAIYDGFTGAKFIATASLLKNQHDITVSALIDIKPKNWRDVRCLIYLKIIEIIFIGETNNGEAMQLYFPTYGKFFSYPAQRDPIVSMLMRVNDDDNFVKAVETVIDRQMLRTAIHAQFVKILIKLPNKSAQEKFGKDKAMVFEYFRGAELTQLSVPGYRTIYNYIIDIIIQLDRPDFEDGILTSQAFETAHQLVPRIELIAWKRMLLSLVSDAEASIDIKYVEQLAALGNARDCEGKCSLDHALSLGSLKVVIFLCTVCKIQPNDWIVLTALQYKGICEERDQIIKYLLRIHKSPENRNIIQQLLVTMALSVETMELSPETIKQVLEVDPEVAKLLLENKDKDGKTFEDLLAIEDEKNRDKPAFRAACSRILDILAPYKVSLETKDVPDMRLGM